MERVKYILIFIVALLLSVVSLKGVEHYLAKQVIIRDASILKDKFERLIKVSTESLNKLPNISLDSFECTDDVQKQLKETEFNASFIRWVGVTKGLNIFCESNEVKREMTGVRRHKISENYHLGVLESVEDKNLELVLIRSMGDIFYAASLIPLEPRFFVSIKCNHCFEYKITFDSSPYLSFGFESFDGDYYISETTQLTSSYFIANFELSGNKDFYNQYTYISWFMTFVIGCIIAMWITYLASFMFQYKQSIHNQLIQGIKHREFIPFYQPVVDSRTNKVVGCEVLMRWRLKDGDFMSPNQFIPYAEAKGLIVEMTEVLLEHVFNDIQQLGVKRDGLFFSINIVPEHLYSDELYQLLNSVVTTGRIKPHYISLEITERYPISDLVAARKSLDKFYALGIELKLDDAGTGYGGFSYVQNLGITTLKIDKMFIDTIGHQDNFNEKTIEAIISFAQKSGLNIIAEGVEKSEQVAYLSQYGVHLIQGYFYSKPLPAKQFFSHLRKHNFSNAF